MMTLSQAQGLLSNARLVGDGQVHCLRVHTDTRTLMPGDLFVALRGEHFDAHDFLPQAAARGAVAVMVSHDWERAGLPALCVSDTRAALGALAAGWRRTVALPLVAVTGSNGKTTVTQMIARIFEAWQGAGALATQRNFNNDIGVPLTLLRLRQDDTLHHTVAVLELGMNHPGEIAQLAAWAAPTVAVVNNAQREHQEFMASVEAVARENGAVIEALGAHGVAVFPADDAYTPVWHALAGERTVRTFALAPTPADVQAHAQWGADASHGPAWSVTLQVRQGDDLAAVSTVHFVLRVAGWHNVKNAAAAAAAAMAAGCPLSCVAQGLAAFEPVKGRSQVLSWGADPGVRRTLVDDTYNANPDSVRAAIEVLAALPGPRWLVLGDMAEVGDQGAAFHAEVGAYAQSQGIEHVWLVGQLSRHAQQACPGALHFAQTAALVSHLAADQPGWPKVASVLVKGSRFMGMEAVVAQLKQGWGQEHAP